MTKLLTKDEYDSLPEELKKQLTTKADDLLVYQIIKDAGGETTLDGIILEYYFRTGRIVKRTAMVARLYKLRHRDGVIDTDPKQKGVYFLKG